MSSLLTTTYTKDTLHCISSFNCLLVDPYTSQNRFQPSDQPPSSRVDQNMAPAYSSGASNKPEDIGGSPPRAPAQAPSSQAPSSKSGPTTNVAPSSNTPASANQPLDIRFIQPDNVDKFETWLLGLEYIHVPEQERNDYLTVVKTLAELAMLHVRSRGSGGTNAEVVAPSATAVARSGNTPAPAKQTPAPEDATLEQTQYMAEWLSKRIVPETEQAQYSRMIAGFTNLAILGVRAGILAESEQKLRTVQAQAQSRTPAPDTANQPPAPHKVISLEKGHTPGALTLELLEEWKTYLLQWADIVPEADATRDFTHLTLTLLELARRQVRSHGGSIPFIETSGSSAQSGTSPSTQTDQAQSKSSSSTLYYPLMLDEETQAMEPVRREGISKIQRYLMQFVGNTPEYPKSYIPEEHEGDYSTMVGTLVRLANMGADRSGTSSTPQTDQAQSKTSTAKKAKKKKKGKKAAGLSIQTDQAQSRISRSTQTDQVQSGTSVSTQTDQDSESDTESIESGTESIDSATSVCTQIHQPQSETSLSAQPDQDIRDRDAESDTGTNSSGTWTPTATASTASTAASSPTLTHATPVNSAPIGTLLDGLSTPVPKPTLTPRSSRSASINSGTSTSAAKTTTAASTPPLTHATLANSATIRCSNRYSILDDDDLSTPAPNPAPRSTRSTSINSETSTSAATTTTAASTSILNHATSLNSAPLTSTNQYFTLDGLSTPAPNSTTRSTRSTSINSASIPTDQVSGEGGSIWDDSTASNPTPSSPSSPSSTRSTPINSAPRTFQFGENVFEWPANAIRRPPTNTLGLTLVTQTDQDSTDASPATGPSSTSGTEPESSSIGPPQADQHSTEASSATDPSSTSARTEPQSSSIEPTQANQLAAQSQHSPPNADQLIARFCCHTNASAEQV